MVGGFPMHKVVRRATAIFRARFSHGKKRSEAGKLFTGQISVVSGTDGHRERLRAGKITHAKADEATPSSCFQTIS